MTSFFARSGPGLWSLPGINNRMTGQPVTVYVDGIYDLTHFGHFAAFRRAKAFGDRLVVGVCGDDAAEAYKRRPIMTLAERSRSVRESPYVDDVVLDAPCVPGALDEAFLEAHGIEIVVCGDEYDVPGDPWYAAPRRLGILRTVPRTREISTSDLIARVLRRG